MATLPQVQTSKKPRRFDPPLASLKGYQLKYLPEDLISGAVVAALTLPISMGYADIVGLPAVYGLYASVVATLVFAIITGTRHIVFGMDSATSAVAGTTLVSMGFVLGTQEIIDVMPLFTLFTGIFLVLFWVFKAGKLVRYVPSVVMHGFIAGISLAVVISQIPTLFGTGYSGTSSFPFGTIAIFQSIPDATPAAVVIAIISLAMLFGIKKFIPKAPGPLIVLAIATIVCGIMRLDEAGVAILGTVNASLPMPVIPTLDGFDLLTVVGGAFSVAVVITIESLLCLEAFSIKIGERSNGNREVISFGIANVAAGMFGCPPCSASISRTAAAMDSRGHSQIASIAAACFIALIIIVLAPLLYYLPRPALSAIVVVALIGVVDYKRIATYARHAHLEFAVFLLTAITVFFFGAIEGVAFGIAVSFAMAYYRRTRKETDKALLGVAAPDDPLRASEKERPNPGVPFSVFSIKGRLTFYNVDNHIDRILENLDPNSKAVILKISKVKSIDATATDKLVQLIELLHARGLHVKLVRKLALTDDDYTRHELRMVLQEAKMYPNVVEAMEGIKRDFSNQRIEVEVPFVTVTYTSKSGNSFSGRMRFPISGEKYLFDVDIYNLPGRRRKGDEPFLFLSISDASDTIEYVRYADGEWSWNQETENVRIAVDRLRMLAEANL